jgi:hypothetical protein
MPFPLLPFLGLLVKVKAFLVSVVTFIFEHWRVFLPLLIVALILICIHTLRMQRDDARKELADYQAATLAAKEKRAAENQRKDQAAQHARDQQQAAHQAQINILRRQYETEHQGRKADQVSAGQRDDLWRERLRLELANAAAARMSSVPEAPGVPAAGGGERNAADTGQARERYIDNLEIGCAVTTSDYNACISSWTKACEIYGCK